VNPALKRRIDQIRRRWWLVLAAVVLGVLAAVLPSLSAPPTYVGKSALVMSSPGRAPEQDTMMVVGYSTIFNQPVTISRLEVEANLPDKTTFESKTVAASPILIIEATANDPRVAQDAAQKMAEAFRDDINSVRQKGNEQSVQDLEAQLGALGTQPTPDGFVNPALAALQDRINSLKYDSTNQLQDLQLRAGVTELTPNYKSSVLLGAVGGFVLGALGAIGLGSLSTRLTNSADLQYKTGIEPLAEIPSSGTRKSNRTGSERIHMLANAVRLADLPKPEVIALTGTGGVAESRALAEQLANLSARQGYRTVLVYADNEELASANGVGFNEALVGTSPVSLVLKAGQLDSLTIIPPGSVQADRYSSMSPAKIAVVLDELRGIADSIIVAAPSIAEAAEAQLLCSAADTTILVVPSKSARADDVIRARNALEAAQAGLLGAVLFADDGPSRGETPSQHWTNDKPGASEATEDATATTELEPTMVGRNGWTAH
jgi:Mrp family chromosome partitioning ATPase/capsular polysaccharide biosynthesis protein